MKVRQIQIVSVFKIDNSIILSIGPSLKQLKNKLGGQIVPINNPDNSPPPLPRIVLQLKDTLLQIGLDRFDISLKPPLHISEDLSESFKFAKQRAGSIISEFISHVSYKWSGIITTFSFPEQPLVSKSGIETVRPIFDRIININRNNRELVSFQLQFGFKDDDFNINYNISGFEERNISISPPIHGFLEVELNKFPVNNCGIQVILDINNKLGDNINPLEDIDRLFDKQSNLFSSISTDLNLKGIL